MPHRIEKRAGESAGPIPFEDEARTGAPAARQPSLRTTHQTLTCPSCGYSVTGLIGSRCPECGVDMAAAAVRVERQKAAREQLRGDYRNAILLALGGIAAMIGVLALRAAMKDAWDDLPDALMFALGRYGITVIVGLAAYFLLAAVWFGSDEPWPITAMRLTAAMALADAVAVAAMLIPLLFVGPMIRALAYVLLLMRILELNALEAVALALCTSAGVFLVMEFALPALGVV